MKEITMREILSHVPAELLARFHEQNLTYKMAETVGTLQASLKTEDEHHDFLQNLVALSVGLMATAIDLSDGALSNVDKAPWMEITRGVGDTGTTVTCTVLLTITNGSTTPKTIQ